MLYSSATLNEQLQTLRKQGEKLFKLGDYDRAISKYYEALTILPPAVRKSTIATFLNAAIGEAYWMLKEYDKAGDAFGDALACEGGSSNPNIAFRIGQCLTECGHVDMAPEYFVKACELGGESLFEDEDIKYYYILHPEAIPQPEPEPEPEPAPEPVPESFGSYTFANDEFEDDFDDDFEVVRFDGDTSAYDTDPDRFDAGLPPRATRDSKHPSGLFNRATIVSIDDEPERVSASSDTLVDDDPTTEASDAVRDACEPAPKKMGFFKRLFGGGRKRRDTK